MEFTLDIAYLKTFTGADDALVKRMLEIFIKNIPTQLNELKQYIVAGNVAMIPEAAHKLKSPFRYVGLEFIAERLEVIESNNTGIDTDGLLKEVDELISIGDECVKQAHLLIGELT